jgi:hypothetical protein
MFGNQDYQKKDHSKKIQKSKFKTSKKRKTLPNKRISHHNTSKWNYTKDVRQLDQVMNADDTNANIFIPNVPISVVKGFLPPLDFIRNPKSFENLKNRFKAQQTIDPVMVDVNVFTKQITGHEGRHRVYVAEMNGIGSIPVIFTFRDNRGIRTDLDKATEIFNIPKDTLKQSDLKVREKRVEMYKNAQETHLWTTSNPFYNQIKQQDYDRSPEVLERASKMDEELYKLKAERLRKEMEKDN